MHPETFIALHEFKCLNERLRGDGRRRVDGVRERHIFALVPMQAIVSFVATTTSWIRARALRPVGRFGRLSI
jgi:hypothetical protein